MFLIYLIVFSDIVFLYVPSMFPLETSQNQPPAFFERQQLFLQRKKKNIQTLKSQQERKNFDLNREVPKFNKKMNEKYI